MKKLVFTSAFLLICLQVKSLGCTCGETTYPCVEFNKETVIFIGRVIESSKESANKEERKILNIKVSEGFRGVKNGDIIKIAEFNYCSEMLVPGIDYLIYTNKHENGLYDISMCSRTRPVSEAQDDLAFLRNLDKVKQSSVFGRAEVYFKRDGEQLGITRMIPNVQIKVFNDTHSFIGKTDESGLYEITDVPPGKYQVEAIVPEGYKWREGYGRPKKEVELMDKGCGEYSVFISPIDEAIKKQLEAQDRASNPPRVFTLPLLGIIVSSFVVIALLLLLLIKVR